MKQSRKVAAHLKRRIAGYESAPSGNGFDHVSDSPNRNQEMHRPGSQNRKKGGAA